MMDALGGRDQNLLGAVAVADRNLLDGAAHVACGLVRFQQQLDLGLRPNRMRRHLDGLRRPWCSGEIAEGEAPATVPSHLRRQVGRLEEAGFGEVFGVHVADGPLVDDAKPGPKIVAGTDTLNLALFNADGLVALPLDEQLNEISARSRCALDHAIYERRVEQRHPMEGRGSGWRLNRL